MDNAAKGIPLHQIIGGLSKDVIAMSSHLNVRRTKKLLADSFIRDVHGLACVVGAVNEN